MAGSTFPEIGLKPQQARAAARRAAQDGKTPSEYLRGLVERDLLAGDSFDQVLMPFRAAFAKGGISEEELDARVTAARRNNRPRTGRKGRK